LCELERTLLNGISYVEYMLQTKTELTPDGSTVELIARTDRASCVRCTLAPGAIARAVQHRSVEEIWHCLRGRGRMWRGGAHARIDDLAPGVTLAIACGTPFQFRNDGEETLEIFIVTVPPWPGADEAALCAGAWTAKL
jgi:mannose-6-phosphate isomerase-like protein (cupin superfamily)